MKCAARIQFELLFWPFNNVILYGSHSAAKVRVSQACCQTLRSAVPGSRRLVQEKAV